MARRKGARLYASSSPNAMQLRGLTRQIPLRQACQAIGMAARRANHSLARSVRRKLGSGRAVWRVRAIAWGIGRKGDLRDSRAEGGAREGKERKADCAARQCDREHGGEGI